MKSRSFHPVLRAGQGLFIGVVCAVFVWAISFCDFFYSLERPTLNSLFRSRGTIEPSPDIVIVEADDASITRFQSWPLPRHVYGDLVQHLTRAGAKTIAFDVMFPVPSNSVANDNTFSAALAVSPNVVQAAVFNLESQIDPSVAAGQVGNARSILPRFQIKDNSTLSSFADVNWGLASYPALQSRAAGLGHVNAPPESDGVLRRVPHLLRFRSGKAPVLYPSLALAAAAHFLDVKPSQIIARRDELVLPATAKARHIPLDAMGRTWVNWIGPQYSFYTYSLGDVLDGKVPDANFKNKVVLFGITAAGAFEYHSTPFSPVQPAVELQANALDDILMQRCLREAPQALSLLLLLTIPAIIGTLALSYSAKISGSSALGLCITLWLSAFLLLSQAQIVLLIATHLSAAILSWSVAIGYRHFLDAKELRRAEERYSLAMLGANDGLWDWDLKTGEVYYSSRWKSMLGYQEDEIGDSIEEWHGRVHPDDFESMRAQLEAHLSGGVAHFESNHRMQHHDGRWIWVLSRGLRVCDDHQKPARMAGSTSDISVQVEAHQQLEHNAFYDALTGLPNRALFMDVLGRAMGRARRPNAPQFAVFFMDLDRFKTVNDSLGHLSGDELLVGVAQRLLACLRPGDLVARLGGDEFTILLDDIEDSNMATRMAERIQGELVRPFTIERQEVFASASIGIAMSSSNYDQAEELLRDADTAMYRAKALGRAHHAVFDEAMHARALAMLRLETDLRRAFERHEFTAFYQPIVSFQRGEICGFEALVRWDHPERGLVTPVNFIPLAEETGLVLALDYLVIRQACQQLRLWHELFPHRELTMSANLSSKQFAQADLVAKIQQILEETRLSPHFLKLEITESVLMDNPESATLTLHQLRDLGIRLSIDDFGTGYSSLSYLHRFPLDTLKVDQSFVRRIQPNGQNLEIVNTIVTLARNLNMDVVAEGVETRDQMNQLCALACDYGQGYYFSRPVPAAEIQALLEKSPKIA